MRFVTLTWLLLLCLIGSRSYAQHAAGYDNVRIWTNFAEFSVTGNERKIVEEQGVTFSATEPVELCFEVLVNPNGKVDYVRIPRCASVLAEYRKGGADALYGFLFEPMASAKEPAWVKVRMRVQPEENLTPQAQ